MGRFRRKKQRRRGGLADDVAEAGRCLGGCLSDLWLTALVVVAIVVAL